MVCAARSWALSSMRPWYSAAQLASVNLGDGLQQHVTEGLGNFISRPLRTAWARAPTGPE
jgi:hypothetical protein